MSNLFTELKRRNVFRVTVAYVIVGWLLAQVADLALENFSAPEWVMKSILLVLAIGLPVAIIFAWAFEMTPEGIQLEKNIDRESSVTSSTGRKLDYFIIALLAVALVYFVYESRFTEEAAIDAQMVDTDVDEAVAPGSAPAKSIAVIPFATFGGNESDGYLSDGLAETLLHLLAQIDELQVAARTSAFKFKGLNEDVRIIGEQLGVATVLEGSVQRSGNRIRITAQLINVENGFHMFSKTFDREIDDIFAVQDEIAAAVVEALEVTLLGSAPVGRHDVEAYDELMRIRSNLHAKSGDEMLAVIESLESLIRDHPNYAEAYATLSEAHRIHGDAAGLIPEEGYANATDAARAAVKLAPDLAMAHIALGRALSVSGDVVEAASVVRRALELEPGNADVLVMQGDMLAAEGRVSEAVALMEQALLRDPLNGNTRVQLATRYQDAGRTADAIATLQLGIDLDPDDAALWWPYANVHYVAGRLDLARASFDRLIESEPRHISAIEWQVYISVDAGDLDSALKYLERGEALSQIRLADERALYCYVTGDTKCWHAATARMLATRKAFFVQAWQARMLSESGLIDAAIEVLLPLVDEFDQTNKRVGNHDTRTSLAALYHRNGALELRDRALGPVINFSQVSLAHGYDGWGAYYDLASAAAARDDADEALRYLEEAYARGYRQLTNFHFGLAFDSLRDNPKFQAFVERIQSENAKQMKSLPEAQ